jgi:hypothetical protein
VLPPYFQKVVLEISKEMLYTYVFLKHKMLFSETGKPPAPALIDAHTKITKQKFANLYSRY